MEDVLQVMIKKTNLLLYLKAKIENWKASIRSNNENLKKNKLGWRVMLLFFFCTHS